MMVGSPRLRTKLINGKLVKVLEDPSGFPGSRPGSQGVGNYRRYVPSDEDVNIKPYNLNTTPVLPPISPAQSIRAPSRIIPAATVDDLYRRLPVDGSMPNAPIHMTEDEQGLVVQALHNHLKRVSPQMLLEVKRDLINKTSGAAAVHEMSMALTRNMVLVPPQLLRLAASMFMSPALPDSINLDGLVDLMVSAARGQEPEEPAHNFPPLPEDLLRLFRFLPRHADLPYEPTLLREQEKNLLKTILHQLLKEVPEDELRDIYVELAENDKDMLGTTSYKCLKEALQKRGLVIHPAVMRLVASQFVSKRTPGEFRYRDLMLFLEDALKNPTTAQPTKPTILPPPPPLELENLLNHLPKYRDLPSTPLLLRENEKVALLKHVYEILRTAEPSELEEIYNELSSSDKNTSGALRYDELVRVFSRRKLRLSHEILRLLSAHFVASKVPGRVDFRKLMMFLQYAQKGEMPPLEMGEQNRRLPPARLVAETPTPLPSSLQKCLRELPPSGLPSQVVPLSREDKEALLAVLKAQIGHTDPSKITKVYKELSNQDNKMSGVMPFLFVRQALERHQVPLPLDVLQLLGSQFVRTESPQCLDFRKLLTFLGLAFTNPPTLPELSNRPLPPLPPEIFMVLQRLPRSGLLPDKPLFVNGFEKEQIRKYLEEALQVPQVEEMLRDVFEAVKHMDIHSLGSVQYKDMLQALEKRGVFIPRDIQQLLGALMVTRTLPGHVDYRQLVQFLVAAVRRGDGDVSRQPVPSGTPRPRMPEDLEPLAKLLSGSESGLPKDALLLKEREKALIMKHLHSMLGGVDNETLGKVYGEMKTADRFNTGSVDCGVVDKALCKNRLYLPTPLLRLLASMFIPARCPGETDYKKLLLFMSAALEPSQKDHAQQSPRSLLPIPQDLGHIMRLIPRDGELPRHPIYLRETEQAKLQDYLQGILDRVNPEKFVGVYEQVAFMDKQRAGAVPLVYIRRAMDQENVPIPPEILQLIASQFLTQKIPGKVEYGRLLKFLAACLHASTKIMNKMVDMPFATSPGSSEQNLEPHGPIPVPQLRPLFRLLPHGGLPSGPLVLLETERRVLLEYLHGLLRYCNVDTLKDMYLHLSPVDEEKSGLVHLDEIKHALHKFQIQIPQEVTRLVAAQFVDSSKPGHVNFEHLIKFLASALKTAPHSGVPPIQKDPAPPVPDLPQELQHLIGLLPRDSDLPDAPFHLSESEQIKMAEYLHDRLRLFEPRLLKKIFENLKAIDRSLSGQIHFTDLVDVLDKFNLKLKYPILRLLVAQYVAEQGKVDYPRLLNFVQSAIVKSPPNSPSNQMKSPDASPRLSPSQIPPHRDIPAHHARDDAKLTRYLEEHLKDYPFDPEKLREAFSNADRHGHGTLQAVEVKDVARMNGVRLSEWVLDQIVERLDYKALGQLSWMQFVDYLEKCQRAPVAQNYIS